MEETPGTRINKYLTEAGFCSRREADKLIDLGCVTINGRVPSLGTKIEPGDEVRVNGKLISAPKDKPVYIALNKPVGIVSTTDTKAEKNNIIDFINYPKRIFPIGRLDKPSEGLIFLTSDGDIVNKILRASNNHEKEYLVTVNRPITNDFLVRMRGGIPILDTITKKCTVEQLSKYEFRIILTQGLNRQIRRMCEYLNYDVVKLKRIRIMNVKLDIPVGKWRYLTDNEIKEINRLVADSTKVFTDDQQAPKTLKSQGPTKTTPVQKKSPKLPFSSTNRGNNKTPGRQDNGNRTRR